MKSITPADATRFRLPAVVSIQYTTFPLSRWNVLIEASLRDFIKNVRINTHSIFGRGKDFLESRRKNQEAEEVFKERMIHWIVE